MLNNGVLRALEVAMRVLGLRVLLPHRIDGKTPLILECGRPLMSPDEKLKQVTMVSMLLKTGVPVEEVVSLLPFDPKDLV